MGALTNQRVAPGKQLGWQMKKWEGQGSTERWGEVDQYHSMELFQQTEPKQIVVQGWGCQILQDYLKHKAQLTWITERGGVTTSQRWKRGGLRCEIRGGQLCSLLWFLEGSLIFVVCICSPQAFSSFFVSLRRLISTVLILRIWPSLTLTLIFFSIKATNDFKNTQSIHVISGLGLHSWEQLSSWAKENSWVMH